MNRKTHHTTAQDAHRDELRRQDWERAARGKVAARKRKVAEDAHEAWLRAEVRATQVRLRTEFYARRAA